VKSTQSIAPIPAAKGSFPAGFDRPEYYEEVTVPCFLPVSSQKASASPLFQGVCGVFFPGFPVRKHGAAQMQVE
jgi:hypothetical protein